MELNKVLTAEETAREIMRLHYLENYKTYMHYDMNNARHNALITVKFMNKQFTEVHKKLVAAGLFKGELTDSATYKFLEEVKAYINNFKAKELT